MLGRLAIALSMLLLSACSGGTTDTTPTPPAEPPPPPPPVVTAASALLTGQTGLAGFALAPDGSTLFVSTESYHGGVTSSVVYALDVRTAGSRPVRVQAANDGLYVARHGVSDDGAFVLVSRDDLHRVSRDGTSDVAVPDSAHYWNSPAMSADGGTIAFVRDDELRVFDVASGHLTRLPVATDHGEELRAVLDAHTVLLSTSSDADAALVRTTLDGGRTTVCSGCAFGAVLRGAHIAGERIVPHADGAAPHEIGAGTLLGFSSSGRTWARIEMIEAQPYEWEQHLHVEGLSAPVDRTLPGSLGGVGHAEVGENGSVVAEMAVDRGEARQSCIVVLHPQMRVVACEPCDSTAEHCR
jgi:hypothetical protein